MGEFSTGFSQKLVDAAIYVMESDPESVEAHRTVLYLSLLSCEITLKSLLEFAGKKEPEIKACSHDFQKILSLFNDCEVEIDIGNGHLKWVSAVRIRSEVVDPTYGNATVGTLLEADSQGASKYPIQIRYGDTLEHYPADLMLAVAQVIINWARRHENSIRIVS